MENEQVLEPPRALISRNPVGWLRYFGPGAIVASVTVGSGEVIFPSRGGSLFSYNVLWVILFFATLKWVMAYTSIRHMILSGAHPLERWRLFPGPKGWMHVFLLITVAFTLPVAFAFLGGALGSASPWMLGIGEESFWNSGALWTTIWLGAAGVLLLIGGYNFLEKAQTAIIILMLLCIMVAVFYVATDWPAALMGLFIPHTLSYPDWTPKNISDRPVLVEVMTYVGVIGGASQDYLAYAAFLRDKKWGRCHLSVATDRELEETAARKDHPARLWLRAAQIDTLVSFAVVVVIACAFCILGAVILHPEKIVIEGNDLLMHQATFLTALSPLLEPLYKIAVFAAFFGSLYGGPEMNYRLVFELLNTGTRWRDRLPARKVRLAVIGVAILGAIIVTWARELSEGWFNTTLIQLWTPIGLISGVILSGVFCLANPWADHRFLPRALRLPKAFYILNLVAALIFLASGLRAFQQNVGLWGLGLLAAMVLVSFLTAWLAPSLFWSDKPVDRE